MTATHGPGPSGSAIPRIGLVAGTIFGLVAGVSLHPVCALDVEETTTTGPFIFAYFGPPVVIAAMGAAAACLHVRADKAELRARAEADRAEG